MHLLINNEIVENVYMFSMNDVINKIIDENLIELYCKRITLFKLSNTLNYYIIDKFSVNNDLHLIDNIRQGLQSYVKIKKFNNIMNFYKIYSIVAKYTKYTAKELMLAYDNDDILKVLKLYMDTKYHFPYVLNNYLTDICETNCTHVH